MASYLDTRSALLAQKMRATSDALAVALGKDGQRPFTTAKPRSEALTWWRQHRYDQYGADVLRQMAPTAIADLDLALAKMLNPEAPE